MFHFKLDSAHMWYSRVETTFTYDNTEDKKQEGYTEGREYPWAYVGSYSMREDRLANPSTDIRKFAKGFSGSFSDELMLPRAYQGFFFVSFGCDLNSDCGWLQGNLTVTTKISVHGK